MARQRKVPITKGGKRIVGAGESLEIRQTLFCGECDRRLKSSATQKHRYVTARVCDNVKEHKTGKIYLWIMEGVEVVGSTN